MAPSPHQLETEQRFTLLLDPCRARVFTFLLRLVGDRSTAEDLYQETLLRAWKSLSAYRDDGGFLSWLFRIAHNVARDDARRRAARPRTVQVEALSDLPDQASNYEIAVARAKRQQLLNRVRDLSRDQREVFLLRMHSEMTFREIAELLGAPESTVIGRMHDAMRKLSADSENGRRSLMK